MKVSFNKNGSKNYMYIEEFEDYDYSKDYQIHMLCNNSLNHTLDFSYDIFNNSPVFKYDITSKQAMSSLFATFPINYKAFTTIMLTLMEVVNLLEEHLISIDSIILKPEHIYIDPEKYTTYYAICPGYKQDFYESLNQFIMTILKSIDHSDDTLVLLAYRVSCDIATPGFNLSSLKNSILCPKVPAKERNMDSTSPDTTSSQNNNSADVNYSDNNSNSQELSDNSLKMLIKSRLFHNEMGVKRDLYTISKVFYSKILILAAIVLLLIGGAIFTYVTNATSHHTSLLLFIIGIAFLFGSIRYLMELYPSAKIPSFRGNLSISHSIENNDNVPVKYISNNPIEVTKSIDSMKHIETADNDKYISCDDTMKNNESTKYATSMNVMKSMDVMKSMNVMKSMDVMKSMNVVESVNLTSSIDDDEAMEYGETILLSETSMDNSHRLVYMGNDYSDDVKINTYPFIIGKLSSSVNLFLNNPLISRLHATIQLENSEILIEDLNSSNGTYLNGKLLAPHEKTVLHSGDTLTFAHLTYMFK